MGALIVLLVDGPLLYNNCREFGMPSNLSRKQTFSLWKIKMSVEDVKLLNQVLLMVKTIEILHFQDNYRVTVKQTEDLNLMENMVRKMQLHQHGSFSSKQQSSGTWSFSSNQRNTTENRDCLGSPRNSSAICRAVFRDSAPTFHITLSPSTSSDFSASESFISSHLAGLPSLTSGSTPDIVTSPLTLTAGSGVGKCCLGVRVTSRSEVGRSSLSLDTGPNQHSLDAPGRSTSAKRMSWSSIGMRKDETGVLEGNINKHQMEADTKTKETTLRTFVWRSVFSDVDINKSEPVFYPETNRLPSELHWSYDVFPAAAATLHNDTTASGSYQVTENNIGEALFMTDWNWNNSIVQNYLSDESDLSEGEKQEVFLTYSKQLDLSLRPEVVENIEESCSEVECSMYSYPDFLPEPFNILDLPELASLKCEKLKEITGATPESSIGKLLSRLLQMEKMQYLTIQKEKLKASRAHLISATGLRSSSPKAFHKQKYSRQNELSSLQLAYEGQYHEENSSWYKHQQNSAKCLCQQFCHCKWASRTSSIRDLTTQPVTRANSACKPSRTLVHSNSHQLFLHRPASTLAFSQIPQTFVEVTKVKLPSNMGTSYSVALRSTAKYKGRKKKPNTNKSKASNKLQLQRQNSLAVLCSSKQDLTQPDKG
uniref:Protein FAM217A isoform X3 n=1 Tax=Geotrypetes seraphini TaxID=260995 RepID=A0A6P8Q5Y6_GEOSA|nr:protein FAM217A isoform X3 [Geotrypetes seraphini]